MIIKICLTTGSFSEDLMVDATLKTFQERNSDLPCVQDTIAIILECRKKKEEKSSLSYAIHVHDCMVSNGLESIDSVKNHLVPLFVDCGSLAAAKQAFHSLHIRSEHAWTSLIKAYTLNLEFCSLQEFTLLDQMEQDGVQPSRHTFMHLLSFCGRFFKLEMGQNIHSKMIKEGHYHHDINELFLTNALVALYGKCGLLLDARMVFNQAPIRDICLWNTLISLYAERNFGEEAILCLKFMEIEGISLDATTFRHILKACISTGDYARAKFFHHMLIAKGFEMETFLIESLVDIYTSCKGFEDAEAVVKALPIPDVESSIALMAAYSESGFSNRVLDCKKQLDSDGLFLLNPTVFVYSLKACGDLRDLDHGRGLHLEVEKYGFGESTVASALITMYSKCGSLPEAQKVFDEMNVRDTVAWTIMLVAYAEHGFMHEALGTLCDMQADNARLDSVACVCGLKACGAIKDMAKGREIHAEVIKEGFETSLLVCNTLLDMYAKGGLLIEACDVFNELFVRDVVAWNTLINAYVGNELYDEALGFLDNIRNEGIAPNESTLINILKACCYAGYRNEGQKIHTYIVELGFERDVFIGNILLDMYCRCGYLIEAQHLFDTFPVRTAVTWSILISGYTVSGLASEALKHSEQMQLEGIYADVDVVLCILKACSNIGSIKKGREAHSYITKVGFQDSPIVGGALVHLYAKCGQLFEAEEILSMLSVRDVVSWSGLIEGFVDLGLAEHALCCYNRMQLDGVSPNAITLFPILKACGDIGALGIGREIHMEAMKEELESDIYVNNTLIDMYAKCGAILEALDLLDEQPQLRDVVSWSSVISGCVDQGEIDTAFSLYKEMQEEGVSPNEVTIMSLLKAYGNIGALEAGRRIHAQMKLNFAADAMFTTSILDMYAKCGCMIDAQVLFNTISRLDIVAFNALLNGYARHGQSDLVIRLFERMKEEGIRPDETTFLNLLIGCDHDGFVGKGQEYFYSLCRENSPNDKHRDGMVNILGRAGRLEEASLLMQEMPLQTQDIGWINLLAASRKLGNLEVGKLIFEWATEVSKIHSAAFVLMANIYAETRDPD